MKRAAQISVTVVVIAAVLGAIAAGWNVTTSAQVAGRAGAAGQTYGGFDGLLAKHGDKSMNLAVSIEVEGRETVEIIGQYAAATDSFLVVKMPNHQDYNFIPWKNVLWVTGRPSK